MTVGLVHLCRLVSSAFLHDSFSHLALNTYALYTVAPEVEAVLGHWTFLSVYLLSGLAGSSAAFVFGDTITVGASTCVFGLIGKPLACVFATETALLCCAHTPPASVTCYKQMAQMHSQITSFKSRYFLPLGTSFLAA